MVDATRAMDAVLGYLGRGWPVFPCHGLHHGWCTCGVPTCSSPAKHPRVPHGLHAASTDPAVIGDWWKRWPGASIGVRTGASSGLVVLDVDPAHGGGRSINVLIDRHGDLSKVPRVRTGGGGWHLFFAHPGQPIANSAGRLGEGLDIRGDGGYVIAPPSMHASGRRYRWDVDAVELPPLPDQIRDLLTIPSRNVVARLLSPDPAHSNTSAWARAALADELRLVRKATEGARNVTLNRSAFCLGQIVGAGVLDGCTVERLLVDGGIHVGLSEREAAITVRSGMRAGEDQPRRTGAAGHSLPDGVAPDTPHDIEYGLP